MRPLRDFSQLYKWKLYTTTFFIYWFYIEHFQTIFARQHPERVTFCKRIITSRSETTFPGKHDFKRLKQLKVFSLYLPQFCQHSRAVVQLVAEVQERCRIASWPYEFSLSTVLLVCMLGSFIVLFCKCGWHWECLSLCVPVMDMTWPVFSHFLHNDSWI